MNELSESLRHTRNGDGAIVLDINKGKMFSTNATGALLFECLSAGLDDAKIIAKFAETFHVDPQLAAADLADFRGLLKDHSLLAPDSVQSE
jgi:hypothetical protein